MMQLWQSAVHFPIEGDLTHSPAGERYAKIVDRLLAVKDSSKQVLITSPHASEGKTVTAVNLAFAFHARLIPVLLAELSFTRPHFASIFGESPLSRGMEDVIAKEIPLRKTVCVRNDNNLNVAMVNRAQATNALLEPNGNLTRVLKEARESFAWTIFDGPSIEDIPNIKCLAANIGMVVLVARARQTRQRDLSKALEQSSHPNTFVLLNDI